MVMCCGHGDGNGQGHLVTKECAKIFEKCDSCGYYSW